MSEEKENPEKDRKVKRCLAKKIVCEQEAGQECWNQSQGLGPVVSRCIYSMDPLDKGQDRGVVPLIVLLRIAPNSQCKLFMEFDIFMLDHE